MLFCDAFAVLMTYYGIVFFPYAYFGFGKSHPLSAYFLTILALGTVVATEISILFLLGIKYMSVYHSHRIFSLDDTSAICFLKIFLVSSSVLLTLLEFTYLTNVQETAIFHILIGDDNLVGHKLEKMKVILTLSLILSVIVLQMRLEYGNYKHGESSSWILKSLFKLCSNANDPGGNHDDSEAGQHGLEYKIGVLRLAALAVIAIVGPLMYHSFVQSLDMFKVIAIGYVETNVLVPSLFIYNHEGLREHFIVKVLQLWCCTFNAM